MLEQNQNALRETELRGSPVEIGKRPPDFTLPDRAGRDISLNSVLGSQRLLIAFAPNTADLEAALQARAAFLERDLTLIAISNERVSLSVAPVLHVRDLDGRVAATYGSAGKTLVYLVGKDGTVKRVWERMPKWSDVYALIDAMPMRRRESRR